MTKRRYMLKQKHTDTLAVIYKATKSEPTNGSSARLDFAERGSAQLNFAVLGQAFKNCLCHISHIICDKTQYLIHENFQLQLFPTLQLFCSSFQFRMQHFSHSNCQLLNTLTYSLLRLYPFVVALGYIASC